MKGQWVRDLRNSLFRCLVLTLAIGPGVPLQGQSGRTDPDLAAGIRQVGEGDFETAVATLEGVVGRLTGDVTRPKDLAQALLYLGIAHVALGQPDPARARFREALVQDPSLRLGPDRFSPKVIAVFEAARREVRAATRKRGSKAPLIILGAGAAAGVTIAAVAGGGGVPRFANARFGTPVVVCPDGSRAAPVPFNIVLEGTNRGSGTLRIDSVTSTLIIETSSIPSEIGFGSSFPSAVTPSSIGGNATAPLRVDSTILCDNGVGDAPRFNEWSGRVTLSTSAGAFTVETSDKIRVNIP